MEILTNPTIRRLRRRFRALYGAQADACAERLMVVLGRYEALAAMRTPGELWDQRDVLLITYGDMVRNAGAPPLATLREFLTERLLGCVSMVHVLPFFPYSSDDGFSVIDYRKVDPDLGTWQDVQALGDRFRLMADLVLNHCSRSSEWFQDHANGIAPARDFFIEVDPSTDLSAVVRPRSKPLLTEVPYIDQSRWVWTTFSEDQIDLNFANPDVLFEFLDILLFYVSMGAAAVRLDAIAYLWKRIGTPCIHLDEAHEVVKLMRDVLHLVAPHVLLITETNVPQAENVSYFGKSDEAHAVYQFSLPPLLAHAIGAGTGKHLTRWAAGMEDPPGRCTYLNFTASHDGIGLRPLEGILSPDEVAEMIARAEATGAHVSTKANADGSHTPYELNCTYLDALAAGDDDAVAAEKFLCSQTVALGLKGIPAIYFNSLLGGRNWLAGAELTGRARTLNRQKWSLDELTDLLAEPGGFHANIFAEYTRRVTARAQHPAFHPKAAQEVIAVDDRVFAFRRRASNGGGSVLCVHNVSGQDVLWQMNAIGINRQCQRSITVYKKLSLEIGCQAAQPLPQFKLLACCQILFTHLNSANAAL